MGFWLLLLAFALDLGFGSGWDSQSGFTVVELFDQTEQALRKQRASRFQSSWADLDKKPSRYSTDSSTRISHADPAAMLQKLT